MPEQLIETGNAATAALSEATGALIDVELITPGWGSSGYYSAAVLEAAGRDKVFAAGTHMYINHPSASEQHDRPERDLRDLAAVLAEDAAWNGTALRGKARVFGPYQPLVAEMKDHIGVSIRAGGEVQMGEAEGRKGRIVTSLVHATSVDFVTHAGRGGRVAQLLESARPTATHLAEARNVGQWVESRIHRDFTVLADDMAGEGRLTREERIQMSSAIGDALAAFVANLEANAPQLYQRDLWDEPTAPAVAEGTIRRAVEKGMSEATANDLRDGLQQALRDAYGGEKSWVWVRDFDADVVWYEHETSDSSGLFQHTYSETDGAVTLTGDPVEVRIETRYVPVDPAGGSTTTTTATEESLMPQIEEARLGQLEEAAGRVPTLEAERDQHKSRADIAEAALAEANARQTARPKVAAKVGESTVLGDRHKARLIEAIVADLPVTDGKVTDEALTAAVEAAVKAEEEDVNADYRRSGTTVTYGSFGSVTEAGQPGQFDQSAADSRRRNAFGVKGA